jgi:hypothetical protein
LAALAVLTWARLELVAGLAHQGSFEKYLHFAGRIVAGDLPFERLGDLSAGYLWAVSAALAAGIDAAGLRTAQVITVSLAAALCAVAARRWGVTAAVTAAAVLLGSRGALVNATEVEPETLLLLLHAVASWLLVAHRGPWARGAAGVALGLSAVTRPTVLVPSLVIACWLGWTALRAAAPGRKAAATACGLFLAGLTVPPAAVRAAYALVPGSATPMNPGTVFYEGLNPSATGYSGEAPRIVKEIELTLGEPDALHVAYRTVAARALAGSPRAADTNRFWLERAIAFARHHPTPAALLLLRKLQLACHSHEAWDLTSMALRDLELRRHIWIPFGLALALAVAGVALTRPRRTVIPVAILAAGPLLVMVLFYVTSRQRNALMAPVAVLAGAGVAALLELWRQRQRRRAAGAAVLVVVAAAALTLDGPAQLENRWSWVKSTRRKAAAGTAAAARERGDVAAARRWQAEAALHNAAITDSTVARLVCDTARTRIGTVTDPRERFDLALAARRCGDLEVADRALGLLAEAGYRPRRGAESPPSVAFQRLLVAVARGDTAAAEALLDQSLREAPGAAEVLAHAVVSRPAPESTLARQELFALHDPFTAGSALAEAQRRSGDREAARRSMQEIAHAIPEWPRPRQHLD